MANGETKKGWTERKTFSFVCFCLFARKSANWHKILNITVSKKASNLVLEKITHSLITSLAIQESKKLNYVNPLIFYFFLVWDFIIANYLYCSQGMTSQTPSTVHTPYSSKIHVVIQISWSNAPTMNTLSYDV